eukprot:1169059-Rhodomonas_salina.1
MMQRRAAGLVAALCAVVLVVDRFHSMSAPVSLLANQDGYASGAPYKTGVFFTCTPASQLTVFGPERSLICEP